LDRNTGNIKKAKLPDSRPEKSITDNEIDQYRRNGVVKISAAFDSGWIVHGSGGNSSIKNRRRAFSTRWTGDDARYDRRRGEVAIPTSDPGLNDGDPMNCEDFPLVWTKT